MMIRWTWWPSADRAFSEVLRDAGRLGWFPRHSSKKGTGFDKPLALHKRSRIDIGLHSALQGCVRPAGIDARTRCQSTAATGQGAFPEARSANVGPEMNVQDIASNVLQSFPLTR
jgi:hypothetical protein